MNVELELLQNIEYKRQDLRKTEDPEIHLSHTAWVEEDKSMSWFEFELASSISVS